jgi:hypothetical protein
MTTSTKTQKSTPAPAPAKRTAAKPKAETPAEAPAAKKATVPAKPAYRDVEGFAEALKSAKAAAKGNTDVTQALQLVTHLAWKTPGGNVGWAKGTTPNVVAYADDMAIPEGTSIPDALAAALAAADKGAADKPQKDALSVLTKVVKAHAA